MIPTFIVSCAEILRAHREWTRMGKPIRDCSDFECFKRCYRSHQGERHVFFDQGRLPGTIVSCTVPKGKYFDSCIDLIVLIF
jgi:hypothetical protein